MSRMAICAVVSAFVLASPLPAQDSKPAPAPTPPAVKKDDTFAVFKFLLPQPTGYTVEIVDVCKASELESKQKELDKINKQRSDDYERQKRDALAAKKKFSDPPPKPETLKVITTNLKTEAEAKALAEKEKKKSPSIPPPTEKAGDKPGDRPKGK
jgi:hypothetical protein